jgi:hypothetical protein
MAADCYRRILDRNILVLVTQKPRQKWLMLPVQAEQQERN